jgi:DNA-binding IscR family transcriptional regulator
MAQIDQDPALRNELQTVSNLFKQNEGSNRQVFDRILGRLKNGGYLQLVNAERGLYQVTAKVEYLLDIIRFLQENDETLKGQSDEADDGQGSAELL